jgi:hypothetical protein
MKPAGTPLLDSEPCPRLVQGSRAGKPTIDLLIGTGLSVRTSERMLYKFERRLVAQTPCDKHRLVRNKEVRE